MFSRRGLPSRIFLGTERFRRAGVSFPGGFGRARLIGLFLQFVLAVGHYYFTWGKTAGDNREIVLRESNRDRPDFDGIILLRREDIGALGTPLNGSCRNHRTILVGVQQQADIHELIWP